MTRYLLTAAISGAVGWWLGRRDVVHVFRTKDEVIYGITDWLTHGEGLPEDDEDWIQPADPVTVRPSFDFTATYTLGDYLADNVEPVPMDDWPELPAYPRPIGGM